MGTSGRALRAAVALTLALGWAGAVRGQEDASSTGADPVPAALASRVPRVPAQTSQAEGVLRVVNPSSHPLCRVVLVGEGGPLELLERGAHLEAGGERTRTVAVGTWQVRGWDCAGDLRLRYDVQVTPLDRPPAPIEPPPQSENPNDQPELPNYFRLHRPTYFITGFTENTQAKFQISFRFNIWPSDANWSLWLTYTQLSFWNIYNEGQPFAENNYAPGGFLRWRPYGPILRNGFDQILVGHVHTSNGRDGSATRSWDRSFMEVRYVHFFGEHAKGEAMFRGYLRLWVIVFSEMDDIYEFAGPGELVLVLDSGHTVAGRWEIDGNFRRGISADPENGRIQLGVRWYPPWPPAIRFTPGLYFQAHWGVFESLDSFDEPRNAYRLGLVFPG
ncbi:MAG: phospholipase A [Sandaracinaceae bacterium]